MDLERFIANRELLERLSREYELLKASGADVDYAAWVRQRLREAAAELAASTIGVGAGGGESQPGESGGDQAGGSAPLSTHEQTERADESAASQLITPVVEQLSLTRRPGPAVFRLGQRPPMEAAAASNARPNAAWFLRGEGTGPTSEALATAIYGPSAPGAAASFPAPAETRAAKASRKSRRVVILSPRKSPPQPTEPRPSPTQRTAAAPPVSKLYTRVQPGLFSARPDAYVHPQARERSTPLAATRPDWVNAASLQAALRGASSAVPHLQAAAEREHRLALSTALARQTLAAGLGADEARAVALYGVSPAAVTAQATQYDHVLQVAQQLAQQNEQLALAVQLNSAQLAQQQALLDSALQQPQHRTDPTAPEGAAAALGGGRAAAAPAARVEVESGPPPWFRHRAPGPAATAAGGRSGLSGKIVGRAGAAAMPTNIATTKSPKKPTTRPRSPPYNAATLLNIAKPTAAAAGGPARATTAAAATAVATTAKERDRSTRREALKALLKQVLGGAGLAGGREGRRRLASSMAEAEKLVAAIQALAKNKAGKDGAGGGGYGEAEPAAKAVLAAETQTSGRASGSGGGATVAAVAAEIPPGSAAAWNKTGESRQPSRAASVARSRSVASAPGGSSEDMAVGSGSRALSRQGSGLASGSGNGEPQFAAEAADAPPPETASRRAASLAESSAPSEGWGAGPSRHASRRSLSPPGSANEGRASPPASAREAAAGSLASSAAGRHGRTASSTDASAAAATEAAAAPSVSAAGPAAVPVHGAPQSQGLATASGGALRGLQPGLMVESLEDQVQQIVERDAAAAAEMARFQKLDALEQRLHTMVDRVENKLARVLQPLSLNAQQQQLQQQQAWELRPGPDEVPPRGPGAAAAAADAADTAGDPAVVAVAAAIAAAAAAAGAAGERQAWAAGGRGSSGDGGGDGYTAAGVDIASPRSAGLSVLELQRMLIQLNRMESKEQEVRRKWFYDAKGPRQRGWAAQPIVVRDGQLGTLDPEDPASAPPAPFSPPSSPPRPSPRPAAVHGPSRTTTAAVTLWSFPPQPPTESALATVASDATTRSTLRGSRPGPGPGMRVGQDARGGDASSVQAQDGTAAADQSLADPISDATLESVLRGRRRFLRAQKLADGDLMAASQPSLNPVQIMEDLTDALLDEVLYEQAQELVGLCDNLGEHMLRDELDISDEDNDR